jgi:hypothetical protein
MALSTSDLLVEVADAKGTTVTVLGETIVEIGVFSREVIEVAVGVKGDKGDPGSASTTYEHVQVSPATTWTVEHNLNTVYPDLTVVVDGRVVHPPVEYALNIATISFPTATAGAVYVRK